jgi:signal transduction protein with GAF and PtsI domain
MIRNLKDTTQKNTEQDWLKTNLAKFSRMLQGQRNLEAVGQMILSELAPVVGAQQAEFYVLSSEENLKLRLVASFASGGRAAHGKELDLGEGLIGQCAIEKRKLMLTGVPAAAFKVNTGLSEQAVAQVLVLPVIFEGQVRGVIELASLEHFNPSHQAFLDQLTESIGIVINTPAGAAADQRGAAGEGAPAGAPERGGGEEEQGSRARPASAGRESLPARADVKIQVGIPGEHVARAAHAAQ